MPRKKARRSPTPEAQQGDSRLMPVRAVVAIVAALLARGAGRPERDGQRVGPSESRSAASKAWSDHPASRNRSGMTEIARATRARRHSAAMGVRRYRRCGDEVAACARAVPGARRAGADLQAIARWRSARSRPRNGAIRGRCPQPISWPTAISVRATSIGGLREVAALGAAVTGRRHVGHPLSRPICCQPGKLARTSFAVSPPAPSSSIRY